MRFVFLFFVGCACAAASSLATVTCTLGTQSVTYTSQSAAITSCQVLYPVPGDELVEAEGDLGTLSVGVSAAVDPAIPASANASSSASASETEVFRSAGPPRPGMIEFVLQAYGNTPNEASISNGAYDYSLSCPGRLGCSSNNGAPPGLAPFELGTNFTVTLTASASGACFIGYCTDAGASVNYLQLFEADGTTPVDYAAAVVPEPGAGGLLLVGIPVVFWLRRRRSCARAAVNGPK